MRMEYDSPRTSKTPEVIYNNVQNLYCRNKKRDELRRDVRISLEMITGFSPTLYFKLTDDADPFFYYSLRLNDEDFKVLKSQQGLLVDFSHFPSQLGILLKQCTGGGENEKFVLILEEETNDPMTRTLQIVEKNEFKHLCHLSLFLARGSDEEIKSYMAKQIQDLKERNMKVEKNLSQVESTLTHVQSDLKQKCNSLEEMKCYWNEEKNKLQLEHLNVLREERDRYAAAEHQWQRDHQRQIQEVERRHANVVADLESQISELKAMNQSTFEKLNQATMKNKELKDELLKRQQDINLLQSELVSARKQSAELDKDYHEKELKSSQLQIQNGILKEELREKIASVTKLQEQVTLLSEAKKDLQEKLMDRETLLKKKIESTETLSKDLMKANEILAKLHNQQADLNTKIKLRTRITIEQEKAIGKKDEEISALKSEIQNHEEKAKRLEESEKELKESLATANQKLEEKEKTLQNNNNVITWLNRRLNEMQRRDHPAGPVPQTATSTPFDARGWIRSPPDVRAQASSVQNVHPCQGLSTNPRGFQSTYADKTDKNKPGTTSQSSLRPPLSAGSGDSRPRTMNEDIQSRPSSVLTPMETKHLNGNPLMRGQSKLPVANLRPPNSAYFARPLRNTTTQLP